MAEDLSNFTIFRLSGAPSLDEIIGSFKGFPELAAPVVQAQAGGLPVYAIPAYRDKEFSILPVFTSPGLIDPPYAVRPSLPFLQLLFSSPSADIFAFNPRHAKARFPAAEVRLDKRQLSAVIGFLQMPAPPPADAELLDAALKNEAGMGNLHRANYLASLLIAGNPSAPPCAPYAETLIGLGLLQEAYDYIKAFQTPDFFCHRASILRLSGDTAKARQWLDKIPAGTPFEDKKKLELAWLAMEEGRTEEALAAFRALANNSFEKTGAIFGTGMALMKIAQQPSPAAAGDILTTFSSALNLPSPLLPDIFIQMGTLNFRTGNYAEAAACYRKAADMRPTIQSRANLGLALIKTGKFQDAAALINEIALTDTDSAGRLASQLPPDSAFRLLENSRQHLDTPAPAAAKPQPAPARSVPPEGSRSTTFNIAKTAPQPEIKAPAQSAPPTGSRTTTFNIAKNVPPPEVKAPAPAPEPQPAKPAQLPRSVDPDAGGAVVSLEAASPRISTRLARPEELPPAQPDAPQAAAPQPEPEKRNPGRQAMVVMESMADAAGRATMPTEAETRKDDFMGRAFKLASSMEEEFGKKIYFNADGLSEVEKKLRLTFMQSRQSPQEAIETIKDCAAFLCFMLQERNKGRLIKMPDFDPWGWPVVFETPRHIVTYPIQRAWKLLWQGEIIPEPGWLTKYLHYVEDELRLGKTEKPQGAAAVQSRILSNQERLIDVQTEHRRIMVLTSSLEETSRIELGRSGIVKLQDALKEQFKPDIPPTADGWKLLRCYGHILAAILAKDFKATWYNVDGNDGFWSMQLPWKTFIFPIGKVYKAASNRESLSEYYDFILADKLRVTGGSI